MNPLMLKILPWAGVGLLVLMLGGKLYARIQDLAELQTEFDKQKHSIQELQLANAATINSWNECILVNEENHRLVLESETRAREAEMRVIAMTARADTEVEHIVEDAQDMRENNEDQTCRLLTDQLPEFLFD